MDNDVGGHWFDKWGLRELRSEKLLQMGLDETDLLSIDPSRMQDGRDGPCHPAELRQLFWRDVLLSLRISRELLVAQARFNKKRLEEPECCDAEEYVPDLGDRLALLLSR
ncbi:hypothetical protein GCM10027175_26710 [Hymenobacter latericoloratus]